MVVTSRRNAGYIPHITHRTIGYQRILDLSSSLDLIHRVVDSIATNVISWLLRHILLFSLLLATSPNHRTRKYN